MDRLTVKSRVVRRAGILGVGLDCSDGHTRITRGDDFLLLGGSDATHRVLQAKVTWFNEELKRRGKTIETLSEADVEEIAALMD